VSCEAAHGLHEKRKKGHPWVYFLLDLWLVLWRLANEWGMRRKSTLWGEKVTLPVIHPPVWEAKGSPLSLILDLLLSNVLCHYKRKSKLQV